MLYHFSIIIPHKNIPQLLHRCLSSIPQTEDIQVLVVDDASTCQDELKKVLKEFSHVELILTTEGKGAGYARNRGLELAKGEWILFADADDFYSDNMMDLIYSHYNDDVDIVYFAADSIFSESLKPSPKLANRRKKVEKYQSNPRKLDEFCRYFHTEPWAKMIKRTLINEHKIKFDETPLANDFYFSVVSAYYARKILFDNRAIYQYTEREGSLSYKYSANKETLQTRLEVYWGVQEFFDTHNVPYAPFYRYSFSEYRNQKNELSYVIDDFWKSKRLSKIYVLYRYIIGKIYQLTFGVHL